METGKGKWIVRWFASSLAGLRDCCRCLEIECALAATPFCSFAELTSVGLRPAKALDLWCWCGAGMDRCRLAAAGDWEVYEPL